MTDEFRSALANHIASHSRSIISENGEWTVKGFIDIYQRIYSISLDTKVLSKILELLLLPIVRKFANEQGYMLYLAEAQNQYPDITLISRQNPALCYALDVKTTYITRADSSGQMRVNGMTLGTFGGYFRNRTVKVGSLFPYHQYTRHYVLGAVYNRAPAIDELQIYSLDQLAVIPSVASGFQFFLHEKYKIASDVPGSGNTKNIGSTKLLNRLIEGTGVFAELGVEVFDDYWMYYQTKGMAQQAGLEKPPYSNLPTYHQYKQMGAIALNIPREKIATESDLQDLSDINEQE
jgi:hypothetical protein